MEYWLARDVLLNLLGIASNAEPLEVAAALRRSLQSSAQPELFGYLASMLALQLDEADAEAVKFLPAEVLQTRILGAFCDHVRGCTERQPHVIVWEDMHWCDPSSRQVYDAMLPLTSSVPLLILSAARPEENEGAPPKINGNYVRRTIRLSPLTRNESGSLVRELLRIENLPEQMRELILNRAEGNPFFLEELLRSLIDAGAILITEGRATATQDIAFVDIPETIQGVIAARIDRLLSGQKQALQRASVVGRVFQQRVLAQLYEESARATSRLDDALAQLQDREFIQSREQQASETAALEKDEYIFKHAITHDVAYDSMLLARRKELHQLAAQAIEALFPERLDELSATLGYHHDRAENSAKAASYLGRAAERATATFANAEAIGFYRSAITALGRLPEAASVRSSPAKLNEGLGDVLTLTGEHEAARTAFSCALASSDLDAEVFRSRISRKLGFSHSLQRHFEETTRAYDDADAQLGAERDDRSDEWWEEKIQIQMERMHLFYWQGRVPEMRALADRWREPIAQHGTPIQHGKFLKMLALSLLMESRFRPSTECAELAAEAVRVSEGTRDLAEAANVRFVRGFIQLFRGEFADAVRNCTIALEMAKRVGDVVMQARCVVYRTTAYRRLRDVARTAEDARRAIALATKTAMVEYVAMAKAHLSWVAWRRGERDEAEKLAHEALAFWHAMEDPYGFDWMALFPLIQLALEKNEIAKATAYAAGMLTENQHPLPDEVTSAIGHAVQAAESQANGGVAEINRLLELAREHHFL